MLVIICRLRAIAMRTDLNQSASVDQVGLLLNLLNDGSLDLCRIHHFNIVVTFC
jgi:hypothetical protein